MPGLNQGGIEFEEVLVNYSGVDYIKEGVSLQLTPLRKFFPVRDITVQMNGSVYTPFVLPLWI